MYEITLVVPSASVATAVTPTVASFATFSAIVFVPEFESLGATTFASSISVTATVKVVAAVLVSVLVAVTSTVQDVAVS